MRINILVAGHESHNRGEDIRRLNYVFKLEMGYINYLPSVIDPILQRAPYGRSNYRIVNW